MPLLMWVHVLMDIFTTIKLFLNFKVASCLSSLEKLLPLFGHFIVYESINYYL
jgi:hypothetical protein